MLNLSDCSGLTELPASLGALTGLQTLDLRACYGLYRLTALPASLRALTGLTGLPLISVRD